jgi:hypothetical protein
LGLEDKKRKVNLPELRAAGLMVAQSAPGVCAEYITGCARTGGSGGRDNGGGDGRCCGWFCGNGHGNGHGHGDGNGDGAIVMVGRATCREVLRLVDSRLF